MRFCSQNSKSIAKDELIISHLNADVNTFFKSFLCEFLTEKMAKIQKQKRQDERVQK